MSLIYGNRQRYKEFGGGVDKIINQQPLNILLLQIKMFLLEIYLIAVSADLFQIDTHGKIRHEVINFQNFNKYLLRNSILKIEGY